MTTEGRHSASAKLDLSSGIMCPPCLEIVASAARPLASTYEGTAMSVHCHRLDKVSLALQRRKSMVGLPGSCLQIAIGTHRLGVAQIVAQLASAGALTLDEAIAKTGMVPKLVQLCSAHQGNNALHSTVASLLRSVSCFRAHCSLTLHACDQHWPRPQSGFASRAFLSAWAC